MNSKINLTEKYLVFNDSVQLVAEFYYSYSSNAKVLYEVVRVKDSTPIFIEFHLDRLWNSLKLMRLVSPQRSLTLSKVKELLLKNPVIENNIRISLVYDLTAIPTLLIYFIPSVYPTQTQRDNGVILNTLAANRENPNAKVENRTLREQADKIMKETGCYEILLVNDEGYITEGSRSNIFFIKGDTLYTPPLNLVLGGITRKVVINIAEGLEISLKEEQISIDHLTEFDSAFVTGTSPGVLPISIIDDKRFNVNTPFLQLLIEEYNKVVVIDIENFKEKI